ncbi:cytochrome p450 [Phlyctema vagabunda]|uniref:Cytochrome p450 n=1 Tax=Phlyctema vagabunda TaxID=108571 RepID=A0ABR4PUW1_9HELO
MPAFIDLPIIIFGCSASLLYFVGLVFYRLYLSPLSKFPGPKLAAATLWYEFYYDVILQGQYTFKIKEYHEKYGPIIRISPYELHVNDPEYYDVLYSRTSPRDKYEFYTCQFGIPDSGFGTVSHQLHRARRQAINPFFSKASISRLEPVLSSIIGKLCSRLESRRGSGVPINIRHLYTCLTIDVITSYGMSFCWNSLDSPDFSPLLCETFKGIAEAGVIIKQFPWVFTVMNSLPERLIAWLSPGMGLMLAFQHKLQSEIQEIIEQRDSGAPKQETGVPLTIFHELLSSNLSEEDKTLSRLWQEGQVVIGAGAETTAACLAITAYHLLSNPDKLRRLKDELETAIPDKYEVPKLGVVEKLPYLSAVILESLRISTPVSSRLQRVAPNEILRFQDWDIPAGTPVGMTALLLHNDESIFPDPESFLPERWLSDGESGRNLERYLVAFSKGSRQCVGLNLARAELSLVNATMFRRFDMALFDVDFERDVAIKHEMFLPQPSRASKGIRVVLE